MCWARAPRSVGRAAYIGVCNPDTHLGGTVLWPRSVLRSSFACGLRPNANLNPRTPLTPFFPPAPLFCSHPPRRPLLFFPTLHTAAIFCPNPLSSFPTLMDPGPRDPKRPGPRVGPGPRESLLVCWASAQGSVGRAPYIGVCNPDTHVGGHRPVASPRPTV